jgi:hypothetical protein
VRNPPLTIVPHGRVGARFAVSREAPGIGQNTACFVMDATRTVAVLR